MASNTPDRLNIRVLWMLAIVGAILCVIGWYRYFGGLQ
jgi:hypothetical protein